MTFPVAGDRGKQWDVADVNDDWLKIELNEAVRIKVAPQQMNWCVNIWTQKERSMWANPSSFSTQLETVTTAQATGNLMDSCKTYNLVNGLRIFFQFDASHQWTTNMSEFNLQLNWKHKKLKTSCFSFTVKLDVPLQATLQTTVTVLLN